MSYDAYLTRKWPACVACGRPEQEHEAAHFDPTYNLSPIFHLALTGEVVPADATARLPWGLRSLNSLTGQESVGRLVSAVMRACDPALEPALRALEPENKWGDLEGAREVLQRMLEVARAHPGHTWEVT